MQFGVYLVENDVISAEELVAAIDAQQQQRTPLGQLAIEAGKLSARDVFRVLRHQADRAQGQFGGAAIELRLLKKSTWRNCSTISRTACHRSARFSSTKASCPDNNWNKSWPLSAAMLNAPASAAPAPQRNSNPPAHAEARKIGDADQRERSGSTRIGRDEDRSKHWPKANTIVA